MPGTLIHLVCKAQYVVHVRSETALLSTRVCAAVWNNGTFNEHTQSMELSTWVALLPPTILSQVTFICWISCLSLCMQYLRAFLSMVTAIYRRLLCAGMSMQMNAFEVIAAMHALLMTT